MEGASLARSVCQRWLTSAPPAAMLELALEPTSDTRHQLIVVFTVQFVAYHAPDDVINPRFFFRVWPHQQQTRAIPFHKATI